MATISSRTDEHPECKGTTFLVDMPIKNRKCDPSDPQPRDIAAKKKIIMGTQNALTPEEGTIIIQLELN